MMPSQDVLRRDFLISHAAPAPVVFLPAYGAAPQGTDAADDVAGGAVGLPRESPSWLRALGPASIAIGAFDGFHIGHRELIEYTVRDARERGYAALAVTFDPDPDTVVAASPARRLTTLLDRLGLLARSGVDGVVVVPFSRALAALDHAAFFERVLLTACDVRSIHVGDDFRLGRGGASTVPVIAGWCRGRGIAVRGHSLVRDEGAAVSASRIRAYLSSGDLLHAEHELGRRYLLRGKVHSGRGEGTGFGFPTANVAYDPALQTPGEGVYSGLALVDGTVWPAAINVGTPPTFRDRANSASLEANLIGFSGDIYGKDIAIVFAERLRGLIAFSSTDELVSCVLGNIETVRKTFGEDGMVLA